MKKKLTHTYWLVLAGLLLCACQSIQEEPTSQFKKLEPETRSETFISQEAALQDLTGILSAIGPNLTRGDARFSKKIASSYSEVYRRNLTRSDEDSLVFHIFNFEDNGGYAIMSGDQRLPSLIALTDAGSFIPGDTVGNSGIGLFFEGLDCSMGGEHDGDRDHMQWNTGDDPDPIDSGGPGYGNITHYGPWSTTVYTPGGMCSVKWGQESPYNKYCPKIGDKQCVTGCAATALSQLMSIHNWPLSYGAYRFDWALMKRTPMLESYSNLTQIDHVAHLMEFLGFKSNLNVTYGTQQSGAAKENIVPTLANFGYSSPGVLGKYDEIKVMQDLKNGYPVLLGGYAIKKTKNSWAS